MKAIRIEIEEIRNKKHLIIYFIEIPDGEIIREIDVTVLDTFSFKMGVTKYDIPIYYRIPLDINVNNLTDNQLKLLNFLKNFGIITNTIETNGVITLLPFSSNYVDVSILNFELGLDISWETDKEYDEE